MSSILSPSSGPIISHQRRQWGRKEMMAWLETHRGSVQLTNLAAAIKAFTKDMNANVLVLRGSCLPAGQLEPAVNLHWRPCPAPGTLSPLTIPTSLKFSSQEEGGVSLCLQSLDIKTTPFCFQQLLEQSHLGQAGSSVDAEKHRTMLLPRVAFPSCHHSSQTLRGL